VAPDSQRNTRYVLVLATVACLILVTGWLARPRQRQTPAPVPSDTELQELARRTQRRSLENTTAFFANLAANVRSSLSSVDPTGLTGVVWDKTRVVTGPLPVGQTPAVATTSAETRVVLTARSRRVPVTVLEAEHGFGGANAVRRATMGPQVGDPTVAVWLANKTAVFAPGSFLQSTQTTCGPAAVKEMVSTVSLSRDMVGGGLFDLDAAFLAMILPCDGRVVAVDAASIEPMIARASTIQEQVLTRYGLLVDPLTQADRRYFQDRDGLLVREVWEPGGASAAVRAGDIVVSLDGNPVASFDELRPLTAATDRAFELGVQRGANAITVTIGGGSTRDSGAAQETSIGFQFEAVTPGFRIDAVSPDGRMARAGIQAGDRLLRLNGAEPTTVQRAERTIAAAQKPLLLEVERDRRRIAIVVP
jgi:membrane-associated protease RseP (regulator of RpoE activity)